MLSRVIRTTEQIRLLQRKDIGEKQRFLMTMARLRMKRLDIDKDPECKILAWTFPYHIEMD